MFASCYGESLYECLLFQCLQFSVNAGMKYLKNIFISFLLSAVCIPDPKAAPTQLPRFMSAPDSKSRRKFERGVSHLCKGDGIQSFLTHMALAVCKTQHRCNLEALQSESERVFQKPMTHCVTPKKLFLL